MQEVTATKVNDQMIELNYLKEDATLYEGDVAQGWELARELDPGKQSVVLVRTGKWTLLDKTARQYVINEFKKWPSVAVLVHSAGQRVMGNFVVQMVGVSGTVKIFDNEEKSKQWLMEKVSKV